MLDYSFVDAQLTIFYIEDNIDLQNQNQNSAAYLLRFIIMNGVFEEVGLLTSIDEELYANCLIWHPQLTCSTMCLLWFLFTNKNTKFL